MFKYLSTDNAAAIFFFKFTPAIRYRHLMVFRVASRRRRKLINLCNSASSLSNEKCIFYFLLLILNFEESWSDQIFLSLLLVFLFISTILDATKRREKLIKRAKDKLWKLAPNLSNKTHIYQLKKILFHRDLIRFFFIRPYCRDRPRWFIYSRWRPRAIVKQMHFARTPVSVESADRARDVLIMEQFFQHCVQRQL